MYVSCIALRRRPAGWRSETSAAGILRREHRPLAFDDCSRLAPAEVFLEVGSLGSCPVHLQMMQLRCRHVQLGKLSRHGVQDAKGGQRIRSRSVGVVQKDTVLFAKGCQRPLSLAVPVHLLVHNVGVQDRETGELRHAVPGRLCRKHRKVVTGVESDDGRAVIEKTLEDACDLARHVSRRTAFGPGLGCGDAVDLACFQGNLNTGVSEPFMFLDQLAAGVHNRD